jgi:predicted transcriptional regulator of viral defense system
MMKKEQSHKTLGKISSALIVSLKKAAKDIFTLQDVVMLTGNTRKAASDFMGDLTKRNLVARINAGTFLLLETTHEQVQLSNWPIIAEALASTDQYYISHYAAMRLHGMTTHALIDIKVTLTKRRRPKELNNIKYHFVTSKPVNFWGYEPHWVSKKNKVNVSDLERTIIDGLHRPEYSGGITEVIRGISLKQNDIKWEKLIRYANRFPSKAVTKRLGYLLESLNLGTDQIKALEKSVRLAKDYVLLEPKGEKKGTYNQRWHLSVNIDELPQNF